MEIVPDVLIEGGGVAACCAAHLARRAGLRFSWRETSRPRLPAILLSESAQQFIAGIFEQKDLFAGCHRVTKRVIAWGAKDAVTVDHSAIVISEEQLLDRLRPEAGNEASSPWTVFTSRVSDSIEHAFGTRRASLSRIEVKDAEACAIESLDAGWLFLIPDGPESGWLIAVGDASLDQSRLIAAMVSSDPEMSGNFPAYPRIRMPLARAGQLSCGSAAIGFDPICGDGTSNAVREAILACAVIGSALKGGDTESLLAHYDARLILGFKRHLILCREFYRFGGDGAWWRNEAAALDGGIAWCGPEPRFQYQLTGYKLHPIANGTIRNP